MKIADVGETIQSIKGIVGIVEKVYENSVLIKITSNPTDISYENMKTVVNHKNYKIQKQKSIMV